VESITNIYPRPYCKLSNAHEELGCWGLTCSTRGNWLQGIDALESMPWVLKSLKIRALLMLMQWEGRLVNRSIPAVNEPSPPPPPQPVNINLYLTMCGMRGHTWH
jgi:hypothetical protein